MSARTNRSGHSQARALQDGERLRSRIANLTLIFFLLLPLEGVLRKWVLSPIQQPLLFIRDPIVLWIYWEYFRLSKLNRRWIMIWAAASLFAMCVALVQSFVEPLPFLVYVIGYRSYLLYIPLAFIIGETLRPRDIRCWLMWCLWISIPIALLVALQFFSPVSSELNKGLGDDVEGRFVVIGEIVRPYGPFTFAQAQATFAALMTAVVIVAWNVRRKFRLPASLLSLATFGVFTMGALSGSRTFFGSAILIVGAYLIAGIATMRRSAGVARLASVGVLVGGFLAIFILVFPTSFAAMWERQADAVANEGSTVGRSVGMLTSVSDSFADAPFFGHGMGAGSNAGAYFAAGSDQAVGDWSLGEYDWPRAVEELGPIVGLSFIAFRVLFFGWLGLYTLALMLRTNDAAAFTMFGFSGYLVLAAQIAGQSQLLSFCWYSVGLTLALARPSQSPWQPRKLPRGYSN